MAVKRIKIKPKDAEEWDSGSCVKVPVWIQQVVSKQSVFKAVKLRTSDYLNIKLSSEHTSDMSRDMSVSKVAG